MLVIGDGNDWVHTLAKTGALQRERERYKEALIGLGESTDDACAAADVYVPHPYFLGEAAFAAKEYLTLKRFVSNLPAESATLDFLHFRDDRADAVAAEVLAAALNPGADMTDPKHTLQMYRTDQGAYGGIVLCHGMEIARLQECTHPVDVLCAATARFPGIQDARPNPHADTILVPPMFRAFCEEHGVATAQVLDAFMADLAGTQYSNGSDERDAAEAWFDRVLWPEPGDGLDQEDAEAREPKGPTP